MEKEALKNLKKFIEGGGDLNKHPEVALKIVTDAMSDMSVGEFINTFVYECDCPCNL